MKKMTTSLLFVILALVLINIVVLRELSRIEARLDKLEQHVKGAPVSK